MKTSKFISLITFLILFCFNNTFAQYSAEFEERVKVGAMDDDPTMDNLVVRQMDGTLAQRDLATTLQSLEVSLTGDTLYISGGNHIIVPGISVANLPLVSDVCDSGIIYETVAIGEQLWFRDNLKTECYSNGDPIPAGSFPDYTGVGDISLEVEPKYWFHYQNNPSNSITYGKLYTWHTALDARGVCPTGYRLPTQDDFLELESQILNTWGIPGTGLKSKTGWDSMANGTDVENFTGYPAGLRWKEGDFDRRGEQTFYMTSTEYTTAYYAAGLSYSSSDINHSWTTDKKQGLSIRCIKE